MEIGRATDASAFKRKRSVRKANKKRVVKTVTMPVPKTAKLGLHKTGLGAVLGGAAGPYGGYPVEAGMPGSLSALDAMKPQLNATNQSALANNGTVNQEVKNENVYNNSYNIVSPYSTLPAYGQDAYAYGGYGHTPATGMYGGYGYGHCSPYGAPSCGFADCISGYNYSGRRGGIMDWLRGLVGRRY